VNSTAAASLASKNTLSSSSKLTEKSQRSLEKASKKASEKTLDKTSVKTTCRALKEALGKSSSQVLCDRGPHRVFEGALHKTSNQVSRDKSLHSKAIDSPASPPALHWSHERGLDAESKVIRYFLDQNYELLFQRLKTPFAEVDLVFLAPDGFWLMVEVKSLQQDHFLTYRISRRQKQRLLNARHFLQDRFQELVELHWAFVTGDDDILIVTELGS